MSLGAIQFGTAILRLPAATTLVVVCALCVRTGHAQAGGSVTLYVDGSVATSGLGTSWNDPLKYLVDALAVAGQSGSLVEAIWVKGCAIDGSADPDLIQFPDRTVSDPNPPMPRDLSFEIPAGVTVYGGFRGDEVSLSQRDPEACRTILSGDIGTPGDRSDNSHTVVRIRSDSGALGDAGLHGLTVEDGEATEDGAEGRDPGTFDETYPRGVAAGVLFEAPGFVARCEFRRNHARAGGVMVNATAAEFIAGATRVDARGCTFVGNRAVSAAPTVIELEGASFDSTIQGGAVVAGGANFDAAAVFSNCLAYENESVAFGGFAAVVEDGGIELSHCTIALNEAGAPIGGGIYIAEGDGVGQNTSIVLNNSIVRDNIVGDPDPIDPLPSDFDTQVALVVSPNGMPVAGLNFIEYSTVEGITTVAGIGPGNLDVDPMFLNPSIGDFRIDAASPVVDAGSSANGLSPSDTRDLDDDSSTAELEPDRTIDVRLAGAEVDMGAFEYSCVNQAADIDNDGQIGFQDLLQLLTDWGDCSGDCRLDLDDDGTVGFSDLLTVLAWWGWCNESLTPPGSVGDCIDRVGTSDPQALAACIEAMMRLEEGE